MVEVKDNKKREVERKIFPGYVLVKMVLTDDSWFVVRNTRGCTGFVGPALQTRSPSPTRRSRALRAWRPVTVEVNYEVGDTVQHRRRAAGGLHAALSTKSDTARDNKVRVTISMFGRETPVELELDQVRAGRLSVRRQIMQARRSGFCGNPCAFPVRRTLFRLWEGAVGTQRVGRPLRHLTTILWRCKQMAQKVTGYIKLANSRRQGHSGSAL